MAGVQVGVVSGWESDLVRILLRSEKYLPSIGDLLYVNDVRGDGKPRTVLMEVVGFEGGLPPYAAIPQTQTQAQFYRTEFEVVARARLFLEVAEDYLVKASRPPVILSPVYLLRKGDLESERIMKAISSYASQEGIAVAMLRSGIAHSEVDAREKHFESALFRLNLRKLVPKHTLVSGQTGSGKTSSVMGLMVKYALESADPIGWLVIDRHGEYTPREGYVPGKFIANLVDAVRANPSLADRVRVFTTRLSYTLPESRGGVSTLPPYFDMVETPISGSSVTLADFATLEGVDPERVTDLEEFITVVMPVLYRMREPGEPQERKTGKATLVPAGRPTSIQVEFQTDFVLGDSPETATANALALVPVLVDNMVRYEGVGLSRDKKMGLHRVLVDRNVDARVARILRKLVLSKFGWKVRTQLVDNSVVHTIDDSRSVVKVPDVLKNPRELACFLKAFKSALLGIYDVQEGDYPWEAVCRENLLVVRKELGEDLKRLVDSVDKGWTVIVDVSGVDNIQGDLVAVTLVRRLFEHRVELGVDESSRCPVVGVISEEAPLYLSREKILSPFNPFARVAREGRKFGVGLVAITQLATLIERQVLANFNTMIVLRTRSRNDLEYYRDLGVPVETLPFLGDREAFLYTPDLPIKEPIPVYLPGWFEYAELVGKRFSERETTNAEATRKLAEILSGEDE